MMALHLALGSVRLRLLFLQPRALLLSLLRNVIDFLGKLTASYDILVETLVDPALSELS